MVEERIYLSAPDMSGIERASLLSAFDSNWIASVGPDLAAFEVALSEWCDRPHVVALSSGTAALHLALVLVGAGHGDEVLVPSFTFVATANAVLHAGATPVFVDSAESDWNMDPDLVAETLRERAARGRLPKAVMPVDLYGQCADYSRLEQVCAEYDVPVIADAAESLGSTRDGRKAGSQGLISALSFNGNKIITTGGGGALLSNDRTLVDRARHLATQAREHAPHYQHIDPGYNYRLSSLLAAVGRGQLDRLPHMMGRRADISQQYTEALGGRAGIEFMPVPQGSQPNRWLNVITVDPKTSGTDREVLRLGLETQNIETRPAWKPMHMQPLFADAEMIGGAVCEGVFETGLCLPAGSGMTSRDLNRVLRVLSGLLDRSVPTGVSSVSLS